MKKTVIIGQRGVITLPFKLRARLGLEVGDAMTVEEASGGLLLLPVGASARRPDDAAPRSPSPAVADVTPADSGSPVVEELEERLL